MEKAKVINKSAIEPSSVSSVQCKRSVSINVPQKMRNINPLTDHEFRYIFRDSIVAKDFINDVLQPDDKIVSVRHNKIKENSVLKKTDPYFNLNCVTSKGENMVIELRNLPPPTFSGGGLTFASVPIYCDRRDGLKYSLNIVSIKIEKDDEDDTGPYCHQVQIIDRETLRISHKNLAFVGADPEDLVQKDINTVLKSKKAGLPVETIAEISGLSPEEVINIIENHQEQ